MKLAASDVATFRAAVYEAAAANPRNLPWRNTTDPYRIMVSEVMLQQTQVERVSAKYVEFISRFPDPRTLVGADFSEVLTVWQGLGYNRRALALKRAAEMITSRHGGCVPPSRKELEALPGIGPYTAGAILAFAFDLPERFIETNIRSVYIHHFFGDQTSIHDRRLLPLIEATLDHSQPRKWYNALMDYGAALKRDQVNPSRRSIHHTRQSPFAGSNRQLRSALLRTILGHPGISRADLVDRVSGDAQTIAGNLTAMAREGLIVCRGEKYFVA